MLSGPPRDAWRGRVVVTPYRLYQKKINTGKAITFPLDVAQQMTGTPGVESLLVQYEQGRIYLKH